MANLLTIIEKRDMDINLVDINVLVFMSYLGLIAWGMVVLIYVFKKFNMLFKNYKNQLKYNEFGVYIVYLNRSTALLVYCVISFSLLIILSFLLGEYNICTYLVSALLCAILPGYFIIQIFSDIFSSFVHKQ